MSHDVPGGALSTAMILDKWSPPQEVLICPSIWGPLPSPTEGSPLQQLLGASTKSCSLWILCIIQGRQHFWVYWIHWLFWSSRDPQRSPRTGSTGSMTSAGLRRLAWEAVEGKCVCVCACVGAHSSCSLKAFVGTWTLSQRGVTSWEAWSVNQGLRICFNVSSFPWLLLCLALPQIQGEAGKLLDTPFIIQ